MKRVVLPALLLTSLAAPAMADITHSLSSSVQLTVDGASSVASRVPSTYSVSGTNIKVGTGNSDVFGGLTAGSATAAPTMKAGTYDLNVSGNQFSFSESWLQGTPYLLLMQVQLCQPQPVRYSPFRRLAQLQHLPVEQKVR